MQVIHRSIADVLAELKSMQGTGDHPEWHALIAELTANPGVRRMLRTTTSPQLRALFGTETKQKELDWE